MFVPCDAPVPRAAAHGQPSMPISRWAEWIPPSREARRAGCSQSASAGHGLLTLGLIWSPPGWVWHGDCTSASVKPQGGPAPHQ